MRNSAICVVAAWLVMVFWGTGNVNASLTERLEAQFLKDRVKIRIDEDWKVQTGNIPEAQAPAYTAEDIRFTTKGDALYAFVGAWPESRVAQIKSRGTASPQMAGAKVTAVSLLGFDGKVNFTQNEQGLSVNLPDKPPSQHAVTLKILGAPTK